VQPKTAPAIDLTPKKWTSEKCIFADRKQNEHEKSRFSEEQIIGILRDGQSGTTVKAVFGEAQR
jgi:hypothetical protein